MRQYKQEWVDSVEKFIQEHSQNSHVNLRATTVALLNKLADVGALKFIPAPQEIMYCPECSIGRHTLFGLSPTGWRTIECNAANHEIIKMREVKE